jgi:hypothetical protein
MPVGKNRDLKSEVDHAVEMAGRVLDLDDPLYVVAERLRGRGVGQKQCDWAKEADDRIDHEVIARAWEGVGRDPDGIDQHAPGAKLDADKLRMGLVFGGFGHAMEQVARIGTYGAKKYSDNGWQSVADGEARYKDALLRHLVAAMKKGGNALDPESGLPHLAHMAWNALAVLELWCWVQPKAEAE